MQGEGEGGSRDFQRKRRMDRSIIRQQSLKKGIKKIDCQLPTVEGREGITRMLYSLMKGSDKFNHYTTKIFRPPLPLVINNEESISAICFNSDIC